MARTKKNAEGSRTPKSKMTVVQKKAPVAKKTFKGNAKTIVIVTDGAFSS
uniref:Poly [ADP-ribose] polymerase n=1 Tax=Parascaris univalens TaxID=6257 RepID=A0A915B2W4_PARUN